MATRRSGFFDFEGGLEAMTAPGSRSADLKVKVGPCEAAGLDTFTTPIRRQDTPSSRQKYELEATSKSPRKATWRSAGGTVTIRAIVPARLLDRAGRHARFERHS